MTAPNPAYPSLRSHWRITFAVWKALFLREAVTRTATKRAAWAWLIIDPVLHATFLIMMFTFIRMRDVGGIDMEVWLISGIMSYGMFKEVGTQCKVALSANSALFAYRQVKPVDTILVRAALEGLLGAIVTAVMAMGVALLDIDVIPDDPLFCFAAFLGMWLMGLGYGLMFSVLVTLLPDVGKITEIIMTPLYMVSGVIFPIHNIPPPYIDWLLLNPLIHGVEATRVGVSDFYHPFPGLDLAYLYEFALCFIFLGLALHIRFADKLVAK